MLSEEILADYRNNVNVWAETSQWGQVKDVQRFFSYSTSL